jgi:hypothetical protein
VAEFISSTTQMGNDMAGYTYTDASEKFTLVNYSLWDGDKFVGQITLADDESEKPTIESLQAKGYRVTWSHFTTVAQV